MMSESSIPSGVPLSRKTTSLHRQKRHVNRKKHHGTANKPEIKNLQVVLGSGSQLGSEDVCSSSAYEHKSSCDAVDVQDEMVDEVAESPTLSMTSRDRDDEDIGSPHSMSNSNNSKEYDHSNNTSNNSTSTSNRHNKHKKVTEKLFYRGKDHIYQWLKFNYTPPTKSFTTWINMENGDCVSGVQVVNEPGQSCLCFDVCGVTSIEPGKGGVRILNDTISSMTAVGTYMYMCNACYSEYRNQMSL
jgi:hypothetical protein